MGDLIYFFGYNDNIESFSLSSINPIIGEITENTDKQNSEIIYKTIAEETGQRYFLQYKLDYDNDTCSMEIYDIKIYDIKIYDIKTNTITCEKYYNPNDNKTIVDCQIVENGFITLEDYTENYLDPIYFLNLYSFDGKFVLQKRVQSKGELLYNNGYLFFGTGTCSFGEISYLPKRNRLLSREIINSFDKIYSLNPNTLKTIWEINQEQNLNIPFYSIMSPIETNTPIKDNIRLLNSRNTLIAFNLDTGRIMWEYNNERTIDNMYIENDTFVVEGEERVQKFMTRFKLILDPTTGKMIDKSYIPENITMDQELFSTRDRGVIRKKDLRKQNSSDFLVYENMWFDPITYNILGMNFDDKGKASPIIEIFGDYLFCVYLSEYENSYDCDYKIVCKKIK